MGELDVLGLVRFLHKIAAHTALSPVFGFFLIKFKTIKLILQNAILYLQLLYFLSVIFIPQLKLVHLLFKWLGVNFELLLHPDMVSNLRFVLL